MTKYVSKTLVLILFYYISEIQSATIPNLVKKEAECKWICREKQINITTTTTTNLSTSTTSSNKNATNTTTFTTTTATITKTYTTTTTTATTASKASTKTTTTMKTTTTSTAKAKTTTTIITTTTASTTTATTTATITTSTTTSTTITTTTTTTTTKTTTSTTTTTTTEITTNAAITTTTIGTTTITTKNTTTKTTTTTATTTTTSTTATTSTTKTSTNTSTTSTTTATTTTTSATATTSTTTTTTTTTTTSTTTTTITTTTTSTKIMSTTTISTSITITTATKTITANTTTTTTTTSTSTTTTTTTSSTTTTVCQDRSSGCPGYQHQCLSDAIQSLCPVTCDMCADPPFTLPPVSNYSTLNSSLSVLTLPERSKTTLQNCNCPTTYSIATAANYFSTCDQITFCIKTIVRRTSNVHTTSTRIKLFIYQPKIHEVIFENAFLPKNTWVDLQGQFNGYCDKYTGQLVSSLDRANGDVLDVDRFEVSVGVCTTPAFTSDESSNNDGIDAVDKPLLFVKHMTEIKTDEITGDSESDAGKLRKRSIIPDEEIVHEVRKYRKRRNINLPGKRSSENVWDNETHFCSFICDKTTTTTTSTTKAFRKVDHYEWTKWTAGDCVQGLTQIEKHFERTCVHSVIMVKADKDSGGRPIFKCNGPKNKTEKCDITTDNPQVESASAKVMGNAVIKNLTLNGTKVANDKIKIVIEEKGEIYLKLKMETEAALLQKHRKKSRLVKRVNVTKLSVGSLIVEYIIILITSENQRMEDLKIDTNNQTFNLFREDSMFSGTTSGLLIQISDYDECKRDNDACDENAHCAIKGEISFTCKCIDGFVGTGFQCSKRITKPGDGISRRLIAVLIIIPTLSLICILAMVIYFEGKKKKSGSYYRNSLEALAQLAGGKVGQYRNWGSDRRKNTDAKNGPAVELKNLKDPKAKKGKVCKKKKKKKRGKKGKKEKPEKPPRSQGQPLKIPSTPRRICQSYVRTLATISEESEYEYSSDSSCYSSSPSENDDTICESKFERDQEDFILDVNCDLWEMALQTKSLDCKSDSDDSIKIPHDHGKESLSDSFIGDEHIHAASNDYVNQNDSMLPDNKYQKDNNSCKNTYIYTDSSESGDENEATMFTKSNIPGVDLDPEDKNNPKQDPDYDIYILASNDLEFFQDSGVKMARIYNEDQMDESS